MRKGIQILTIILTALIWSCSNDLKNSTLQKPNEGSLHLGITTPQPDDASAAAVVSRARAELTAPEAASFLISISRLNDDNSQQEVLAELYEALPYTINLLEGNYRAVAQVGSTDIFSTENPLYLSRKDFVITRGSTTDLSIIASIVPYAIQINYSADFAAKFESCYIEAEIDGRSGYVFANLDDQNRMAYIMPSECRLILKGVLKDGQKYSSVIKEINSTGRELYTLNLRILPKGHAIDINVETKRTEITSQGQIPLENLPDIPPISASWLEFYETMATPIEGGFSAVTFSGIAGIASIEFTPIGGGFSDLGLADGVTYKTSDPTQMAALVAAGVTFPSDWVGKKRAEVNFGALAQTLLSSGGAITDHVLQCRVTDITGKVGPVNDMTIKIHPPVFVMPEVLAGNVWTKTATASPLRVDKGDVNYMLSSGRLKYQFSADNATWSDLTADQLSFSGLNPTTTYYVRAAYGDLLSNTVSFTTETPTQVPNAGFENWTIEKVNKGFLNSGYHNYKPWNGSVAEWWNTSNARCFTYNATTTQYNNPTSVLYTKTAKSGDKTAEIRSVKINVGGRSNVCGKLLIGSLTSNGSNGLLTGNNNPEYLTEGRDFASRPTKIRFWYKYNQYGTDNYVITVRMRSGSTVIAQAIVTGEGVDTNYKQMEIELPYSNTELKATSLYVCFASSKNDSFENRTIDVQYPDGWSSGWEAMVGSILWIDDVELIYDK